MPEHLTRNTEYDEHLAWCHHCQKYTDHRRRPGEQRSHCVNPTHVAEAEAALQRQRDAREIEQRQHRLFPREIR